MGKHLRPLFLM